MKRLYDVSPGLLRSLKRGFQKIRQKFFTKDSTPNYDLKVHGLPLDEIRIVLGNAYFTNGWELSWNYKGEVLNMRRPKRYDDEYEWYQTHVRVFDEDDGYYFEIHEDLEPTEYPYYHLHPPSDSKQSVENSVEDVTEIFDEVGIEYEVL